MIHAVNLTSEELALLIEAVTQMNDIYNDGDPDGEETVRETGALMAILEGYKAREV